MTCNLLPCTISVNRMDLMSWICLAVAQFNQLHYFCCSSPYSLNISRQLIGAWNLIITDPFEGCFFNFSSISITSLGLAEVFYLMLDSV